MVDETSEGQSRVALLDNGSLRPESTLEGREVARALAAQIEQRVDFVSVAHSNKVDPDRLGGKPAVTFQEYVAQEAANGVRRFLVLPLFFGPSYALARKVPQVVGKYPNAEFAMAHPLVRPDEAGGREIGRLIAGAIAERLDTSGGNVAEEACVLDHGSPLPEVAVCREAIVREVRSSLTLPVVGTSMERRAGAAYDFNEPTFSNYLESLRERGVFLLVVGLMFFFPGRHAGPGGDIEEIYENSQWRQQGGRAVFCDPLARHPGLVSILAERFRELVAIG